MMETRMRALILIQTYIYKRARTCTQHIRTYYMYIYTYIIQEKNDKFSLSRNEVETGIILSSEAVCGLSLRFLQQKASQKGTKVSILRVQEGVIYF